VDPLRAGDEGGGPDGVRAFFALELAPPARAAASALARRLRERPGGDAVRWVRAANLHVTLRFLGEIARERVGELVAGVAAEAAPIAPLRLRLAAARLFPSARRPRVVALGIEPEAPLLALAAAVERGVRSAGFAPDARRFRPHLTLGRIPPRADFPRVTAADTPDADAFDVRELLLLRSDLHPDGARYTALDRVALGRAGVSA
jgi:2'-5' RNA ligase